MTLSVVSVLLLPIVLFTGFSTWLTAEPLGGDPLNTPRAAGITVASVSVASQAVTILIVVRSAIPLVVRALTTVGGMALIIVHGLFMNSVIGDWQRWGTSPKFWSGSTHSFRENLEVSILAPVVCGLLAWGARPARKNDRSTPEK